MLMFKGAQRAQQGAIRQVTDLELRCPKENMEAPVVDAGVYCLKYPSREFVHWLLQTDKEVAIPVNNIISLANIASRFIVISLAA